MRSIKEIISAGEILNMDGTFTDEMKAAIKRAAHENLNRPIPILRGDGTRGFFPEMKGGNK
jgi:hypothetical protein